MSPSGTYASTSPSDAAVALRSFPRRFRSVLQPIDDDHVDEWAHRVGTSGTSAFDHLVQASRGVTVLHQALRQALNASEPPTLPPAVLDESARAFDTSQGSSVDAELELLADEAEAMATGGHPERAEALMEEVIDAVGVDEHRAERRALGHSRGVDR